MKLTQAEVAGILLAHGATVRRIKEFLEWHSKHRDVWVKFNDTANRLSSEGEGRIGAKAIGEAIRKYFPSGSEYGLNNNWLSYYVRIWCHLNPVFKNKVELRKLAA